MLPTSFPPLLKGSAHVKVCGLTRAEDAQLALDLGASFIGLIFAAESPRRVTREQAKAVLDGLRTSEENPVLPIGVFVHEPIEEIVDLVETLGLAGVQMHSERLPEEIGVVPVPVIQAVRVGGTENEEEIETALKIGPVLLDTFVKGKMGGTGKTFDHAIAQPFLGQGAVFIAGGLNPENIGSIVSEFRTRGALPYAFDVSSGLEESPGVKSPEKMRKFFAEVERALQ
ncbi:phosphoribosylanthranilate isomerase [bacterium]|nr:phosphoribosylanthranilate isomerase [bacterium]